MKHRTISTFAAAVLASLPWTAALAQPAPTPDNKPADAPPGDKPAADKPADKPVDKPADKPADKPVEPADKPAEGNKADAPKGEGAVKIDEGAAGKPVPGEKEDDFARRPFVATSRDFKLWPVVLLQAQATPYIGSSASFLNGDIAERAGFRLRRARFGVGGSYKELVEMELSGELITEREATLALHEAWVGVKPSTAFGASMGILPVPFSRFALTSAADTALIDRPLAVRSMAPNYQLGALVGGSLIGGRLNYAAGVFNGFARGDQFYTGFEESLAALGNRFENLAYVARLSTSILTPGADIPRYGDDRPRLNVGASAFFSDGGARTITSAEGDVFFYHSGFQATAEVLYSSTAPVSQPSQPTTQNANIDSLGGVLEVGYTYHSMIGGHVRFEYIDPNMTVQDASDNWLATAGVSFMPPQIGHFVRAQLEYTHREEMRGLSIDNDAVTLQTQFVLQ